MRRMSSILLALLMIGCGTDAPAPEKSEEAHAVDPTDPCSFLSRRDIAEAVGGDVKEGQEVKSRPNREGESVPLCIYTTGPPYASVMIQVESPVTEKEFQRHLRRDPLNTKEVLDIGDLAYIHGAVSLSVFMADAAVTATVQDLDSAANTEVVLRKIGSAIVRRMQT